jgi:hypothetical protein
MLGARTLPVATPGQTALGCQLYNRLGMVSTSYRDWFAEGTPHEWVRALDAIQQTLTQCKRIAALAAEAERPAQGGLFDTGRADEV